MLCGHLEGWFPAHWALVLHQLQHKEDDCKILLARSSSHSLQFHQEHHLDPSKRIGSSVQGGGLQRCNVRMLTCTLQADLIQLPVERYLAAALPTLKQGVIAGVQDQRRPPWAITRAEKLQISVFLPNELSIGRLVCRGLCLAHCVA